MSLFSRGSFGPDELASVGIQLDRPTLDSERDAYGSSSVDEEYARASEAVYTDDLGEFDRCFGELDG